MPPKKRGRPPSALTEDPVRNAVRERNRLYRRAFDARKRAQQPEQRPATAAQLQQGEAIINFADNNEEITPTIDALGLRVQGLAILPDTADAQAQQRSVAIDEHDALYINFDFDPPPQPTDVRRPASNLALTLVPVQTSQVQAQSGPSNECIRPSQPVHSFSGPASTPQVQSQSGPSNGSIRPAPSIHSFNGPSSRTQPHSSAGPSKTPHKAPAGTEADSAARPLHEPSLRSPAAGPSNANARLDTRDSSSSTSSRTVTKSRTKVTSSTRVASRSRITTTHRTSTSTSSSNSITRFFTRQQGHNPFEPHRSPSLPPLPANARPHVPRGLARAAPPIYHSSSDLSESSTHSNVPLHRSSQRPSSPPHAPSPLIPRRDPATPRRSFTPIPPDNIDPLLEGRHPNLGAGDNDNFDPGIGQEWEDDEADAFTRARNKYEHLSHRTTPDDHHPQPQRPFQGPHPEIPLDNDDDDDIPLNNGDDDDIPPDNGDDDNILPDNGDGDEIPPNNGGGDEIPPGNDDDDGVEEEGGEFEPEQEGLQDEDEEQAAIRADRAFVAQRLYDTLQGGFTGCLVELHTETLVAHLEKFERLHEDHHGLDAVSPSIARFPHVLSQTGLLTPQQLAESPAPSPEQWSTRFCGVARDPARPNEHQRRRRKPRSICLHAEQTQEVPPDVAFDIDSYLGFASSISVARQGLWYQPVAQMKQNIATDVHVESTAFRTRRENENEDDAEDDDILRPYKLSLKDIPHFFLGRVVGATDIGIYVLFPHLPVVGKEFKSLTQEQLTQWLDKIFHPAVYEHCPAHITQHLTASYRQALAQSKAHQVENRRATTSSYQSQQTIGYHLQPEYLVDIWASVLENVALPGLQQFREPQLFFSAKGTKLQFKSTPSRPTLLDAMENFQLYLERVLDMQFVHLDRLYIDIGKEVCPRMALLPSQHRGPEQEAQTYILRRCCAKYHITDFYDGRPPSDTGDGQRYYTQNMLYDACTLTSVTPKKSRHRKGGLIYSQYYNSCKEVWDATKLMPFENDGLEELALDPLILATIKTNAGGNLGSVRVLRNAYCAAKRRTHFSLKDSEQKSYGVREEHRVTWALFQEIMTLLQAEPREELEIIMEDAPSYVWPIRTSTYLNFLWRSADKFACGFEYIHAQTNRSLVTWEQTKMMAMFLRCLRFVLGGQGLFRESALWDSRRRERRQPGGEAPAEERAPAQRRRTWIGLGFRNTMPKYGYAWIEPRIDWANLQFHDDISHLVLFGNSVLRGRYLARGGRVRDFISMTHVLEKGLRWLPRFRHAPNGPVAQRLLSWIIHMVLRQFRIDVMATLPRAEFNEAQWEEALTGESAFTFNFFDRIQRDDVYLVSGNRTAGKFTDPYTLAKYFFNFNDDQIRQSWGTLGFRSMYQRTTESLAMSLGRNHPICRKWELEFMQTFFLYHWIWPVPHSLGLLQLSKRTTTQDPSRMWYSIAPMFHDGDDQVLTPTHLLWKWSKLGHYEGPALDFPPEASWSDEEMQAWVEQVSGEAL